MKFAAFFAALIALVQVSLAHADQLVAAPSPTGTLRSTPTGVFNAADYGAVCNGSNDDAVAVNAAVQAIRNQTALSSYSWPIGFPGRLVMPPGNCTFKTTLNLTSMPNSGSAHTALYGAGLVFDALGTQISCQTNGTPCIDATGTGQMTIIGLNVYGSCTTGQTPSYGLVLARATTSLATGADHVLLTKPTLTGCFSTAAYYNRSSETTKIDHGGFYNWSPNAYVAIWDGSNYFNFQSAFTGQTYTQNVFSSFNEDECDGCLFESYGSGTVPLWLGGTYRHSFTGSSYAYSSGSTPCVVMSFANGVGNDFLNMDLHCENTTLTSIFRITGASAPVLNSFRYRDHNPFQSGPLFSLASGVSTLKINDAELHVGTLGGTSPSWWDNAANYTVNGYVYSKDGTFTTPGTFNGIVCTPSCAPVFASYGTMAASSVSAGAVYTASLGNPGGVTAINLGTPSGGNPSNWTSAALAGSLPAMTFTPTNGVGSGAAASLGGIVMAGVPTISGGAGCSVGDTIWMIDPQSGGNLVGGGQAYFTVTTVSSGAVTAASIAASSGNAYYWAKPLSSGTALSKKSSTCTTLPTLASSSGYPTASWAFENGLGTLKATITLTSSGAGYTAAPTVGVSPAFSQVITGGFPVTTTLSSTFAISGGAGAVTMTGSGTAIGVSGSAGSPFIANGATVDASGVRYALTGAAYTVPANTSLMRFTQTATVASQTVTLPTASGDGHVIQFVNYAGAVTALTFSPAVTGWTNGSALAANTGLRIRWDATAAAWQREQ